MDLKPLPFSDFIEINYDHHIRMDKMKNEKWDDKTRALAEQNDIDSYHYLFEPIGQIGGVALELGCAWGRQFPVILEFADSVMGIDLHRPSIERGQKAGLACLEGIVEALQFADNSFDVVCSRHVLEHTFDYKKALAEILRVLKPGGWTLNVTPHDCFGREPAHITELTWQEWEKAYREAGFNSLNARLKKFPVSSLELHFIGRKPCL